MTIKKFLKLQVVVLLFAAIISPLSALAAPATIKFVLSTKEVTGEKTGCASSFGGNITGIGTGMITDKGKSTRLGVLTLTADDCITPLDETLTRFSADGNLTLTDSNGNNIMAHYSVSFIPATDSPPIYVYENFTLDITGGTGLFTGATGFGILEGNSNIWTGVGAVEGTAYLK